MTQQYNIRRLGSLVTALALSLAANLSSAQTPMQLCWEYTPNLGVKWIDYADTTILQSSVNSHLKQLAESDLQKQFEAAQWFTSFGASLPNETKQVAQATALAKLRDTTSPRSLRLALASAFVALDAESTGQAAEFWQLSKPDPALRRFAEEALIQWKLDYPRQSWLARLEDPRVQEADLLLALRGLTAIHETSSTAMISRIISQERGSQPLLLQACQALGQLSSEGQEPLATQCLNSGYSAGPLMAARIIINHPSQEASEIVAQLIQSRFLPARRLAFLWLTKNAPQELASMLEKLATNEDAGIRMMVIEQFCKSSDAEVVRLLGLRLKDELPAHRQRVRDGLIQQAQSESLAGVVFQTLDESLKSDFGPGCEEAIETAVALKATQFNPQLMNLLDHPMPQIRVRAAWGLQELGVQEPQQLNAILDRCLKLTSDYENQTLDAKEEGPTQWAYLLAILGKAKHRSAETMLRKYVTKHAFPTVARTAGIWSLGNILQGSHDSELAALLAARMMDSGPMGEDFSIRYCAALAIGFIASPESKTALHDLKEYPPAPVGRAAAWALSQVDPNSAGL